MKKEEDVYFIYEKPVKESMPILYGYFLNDEKPLLEKFKKQRKMDMYDIVKRKVNKKELRTIVKHIQEERLHTFNRELWIEESVYVLLSEEEYINVILTKEDYILHEIAKHTSEFIRCCKDEWLKILNTLCYFDFYRLRLSYSGIIDDGFVSSSELDYVQSTNFKLDQLGVFITLYGYKLNLKTLQKELRNNNNEIDKEA